MQVMRLGVVGGLVAVLAACAAQGPRMQEVGENSYMVTIDAEEVPEGKKIARREAMQVAEAHCVAMGQHALPTHLTSGISEFMQGGEVELNFRCQQEEYTGP